MSLDTTFTSLGFESELARTSARKRKPNPYPIMNGKVDPNASLQQLTQQLGQIISEIEALELSAVSDPGIVHDFRYNFALNQANLTKDLYQARIDALNRVNNEM